VSEFLHLPTTSDASGVDGMPVVTSAEILLRVEDAAHRLQVSRAQLYRLIASGEVGSVKIGASRRVPVRCLDAFVDRLIADQV
jgi:excisionase family DNA binding protein